MQLGHRFYRPELGRFITKDPAREGVNWYAYVGDRPTMGGDLEGRSVFAAAYATYRIGLAVGCGAADVYSAYQVWKCEVVWSKSAAARLR